MTKISTQPLVEKWSEYEDKWLNRQALGCNISATLSLFDVNESDTEFRLDAAHVRRQNGGYADVALVFNYGCHSKAKFLVDIKLDFDQRNVKVIAYPDMFTWGEDKAPLVVSYSDLSGRSITLRPREFDQSWVTDTDVSFVELLFNEATISLGLVPEVPFDFDPVRRYVAKQDEIFQQTQELWQELSDHWYRIAEVWDNQLSE